MFDASMIKITQINLINVTLPPPGTSFGPKASTGGTEDVGLSHEAMKNVYGDENLYSQVDFRGYRLPYTLEAVFFNDGSTYAVPLDDINCVYTPSEDLHITPQNHPLSDSSLITALRKAYSKRRWDNISRWGVPSAAVSSRTLLRIANFDRHDRIVQFSKTDYDTQAVTNLVPDLVVNGKTLRKTTFENMCLPKMTDKRLANNLGISILFVDAEGVPYFPLRAEEGVAVFPGEWGCTVSFAADFPESSRSNLQQLTFQELISTALSRQLSNELKAILGHLTIIPLALTREWFRLGKTQLFMVCESPYTRDEIMMRLKKAPHSDEVASKLRLFILKNKVIWDGKSYDRNFSIEALCNWGLYVYWKSYH